MKLLRSLPGIILLVIVGLVLFDLITVKCVREEDTCYRHQCTKHCYDVITPCSAPLVTGHKVMCVEKQHFWEGTPTITNGSDSRRNTL